jgi:hypothetical protein
MVSPVNAEMVSDKNNRRKEPTLFFQRDFLACANSSPFVEI